jgi:hypothetical protein
MTVQGGVPTEKSPSVPLPLRMSEALLQGLVAHLRRCRREKVQRAAKLYPNGYLISYGQLIEQSAVRIPAAWLTAPLSEMATYARSRGWPDIAALVVNQQKGYPGPGYFKRPGAPMPDTISKRHLKAWEQNALACMEPWPLPRGTVRFAALGLRASRT